MDELNIVLVVGIVAFVVTAGGLIVSIRRKHSTTAISVWATATVLVVIATIAYNITLPLN